MRITVHVLPKAKSNRVTQITPKTFKVATTAPADDNKANIAVTKLLAQHFGVRQSDVFLISGQSQRKKLFDILIHE